MLFQVLTFKHDPLPLFTDANGEGAPCGVHLKGEAIPTGLGAIATIHVQLSYLVSHGQIVYHNVQVCFVHWTLSCGQWSIHDQCLDTTRYIEHINIYYYSIKSEKKV